ncbi:phage portal protein [Polynucleobacter sp.]|uniref:phage portal protein n=1 Tax=Polynucleobacter sp. TaxID=2029855 RepID=UPI003F6A2205
MNLFSPSTISRTEFLKNNNGYVHTCVNAIASEVAKIEIEIQRKDSKGDEQEIKNHPFLTVLNNPNPDLTKFQLFEFTQSYLELTGDAFWFFKIGELTRRPKEVYILRSDLVQVVVDENTGLVSGYIYNAGNGKAIPLDKDEVLHFKMPNPEDPYRGLGVIQAGQLYIQTEQYASRFTRNFIYNNARPSGILNLKGRVNDKDFAEIKSRWKNEYGTVDNAGKTAILRNVDADFVSMSTNLAGVDLKEAKNMSRDDIMAMFRVSKPILGITEDVNYANAKTAEYVFAKRVIEPKMERISDTLAPYIKSTYGDETIEVEYESPVPQDIELELQENQAAINSWKTINEVRQEQGLTDVANGDQVYIPMNMVPVGQALPEANLSKDVVKKSFGKIIVRKKENKAQGLTHESKEHFRGSIEHNNEIFKGLVKKKLDKVVKDQEKFILGNVKPKTIHQTKDFNNLLFDYSDEVKKTIAAVTPELIELASQDGELAYMLAGGEANRFAITETSLNTINSRIEKAASGYTQQTLDGLRDIFTEATNNGESYKELTADLKDFFDDADTVRSERWARTEVAKSASEANREAYRQLGTTELVWFANPGACEICQALNGEVVGVNDSFIDEGDTLDYEHENADGEIVDKSVTFDYDSCDGGDAHPNCTCTIVPKSEAL